MVLKKKLLMSKDCINIYKVDKYNINYKHLSRIISTKVLFVFCINYVFYLSRIKSIVKSNSNYPS